jgi:hypothetical protein
VRRHLIDILDAEQLAQLATIAERVVDHLRNQSVCTGPTEDSGPVQAPGGLESTSAACTLAGPPAGMDRSGWPAATDER